MRFLGSRIKGFQHLISLSNCVFPILRGDLVYVHTIYISKNIIGILQRRYVLPSDTHLVIFK